MSGSRAGKLNHVSGMLLVTALALLLIIPMSPAQTDNRIQVILEFDDAWRSQYYNALPVLEEFGFTGTFFPFIIDHGRGFGGDQGPYMTWEEIIDLQEKGMEIGSQGWNHPDDLRLLTDKQIIQEVVFSKDELEKRGLAIHGWTYPNNAWNEEIMDIVRQNYNYSIPQSYQFEKRFVTNNTDRHSLEGTALSNEVMSEFASYLRGVNKTHSIILIYHEIHDEGGKLITSIDGFKEQMKYLHDNGYVGVSFANYFGLDLEGKPAVSETETIMRYIIAIIIIGLFAAVYVKAGK